MARFWIDMTLDQGRGGYLIALCDRCAEEEITKEACRARGWIEIPRSHPRVAQEGAWYCQVCGDLL